MEHEWRAVLQYSLTPKEARQMVLGYGHPEIDEEPVTMLAGDQIPAVGDPRVFLGKHNLIDENTVIVCWNCELAWDPIIAEKSCKGSSELPADLGVHLSDSPPIGNVRLGLGTVNRNDPCPCGSGKKFKRCHGA